ncbi:cell division protein ZipA C-terminal FtsZ-binding domain-containing protein [Eikenella longinqua]|uniref:cell division protein ZipA C-terminal FtsZ-binding domain-containing protein n=1 Tax=Eikenella longinqua TaxID=1795827 RepID=UPI0009EE63D8|nr:cell division protein ZipA C-terminal FtsZ-binding domain-containing protein [Eikenella longinqua]
MSTNTILIIAILVFAPVFGVLLYNTYQEKKYRDAIRAQFGHADKDALLESHTHSVRDGQQQAPAAEEESAPRLQPAFVQADRPAEHAGEPVAETLPEQRAEPAEPVLQAEPAAEAPAFNFQPVPTPAPSQTQEPAKRKLLLDLQDLAKQQLPWFDSRFDYLCYISLKEPQELHAMPRLSSRHRFRIAGCTMDDRFQIAEPIPSVYYQGFVIGLQAISRNGLASIAELEQFGEQANAFAEKMDGGLLLTDIDTFLSIARPLDELCARVDQTIAIHLVSRNNVSGVELRNAVERQGFELSHDGMFYLNDQAGEPLFAISTLDNSAFTATLLSSQNYRGISMLFDAPHIPDGEKNFNRFMDIAVKLSSMLGLDLVNDKLEELSTQWLKEIRSYVVARQDEMKRVGIEPGSELAKRLFS